MVSARKTRSTKNNSTRDDAGRRNKTSIDTDYAVKNKSNEIHGNNTHDTNGNSSDSGSESDSQVLSINSQESSSDDSETSKDESLSHQHKKRKSSGKGKSSNERLKVSKNNNTATSKRGKSLNEGQQEHSYHIPPGNISIPVGPNQISTMSQTFVTLDTKPSQEDDKKAMKDMKSYFRMKWYSGVKFVENDEWAKIYFNDAIEQKAITQPSNISNQVFNKIYRARVHQTFNKLQHNSQVLARRHYLGEQVLISN